MSIVKTKDGTEVYSQEWSSTHAQPIMFHHGWPLSPDDWDAQLLFSLRYGNRAVAHDRRGHGQQRNRKSSPQPSRRSPASATPPRRRPKRAA
jgi:pimeloyl-ACP methyl ester carboxylesterase